jgi:hypothetical protein
MAVRLADVAVRIGEDFGDERAEVLDIEHLQRNVWLESHRERAVLDRVAKALEVLCEKDRTNDRRRKPAVVGQALDHPLGVEVGDSGLAVGAADRREHEVIGTDLVGEFDDVPSLLDLGVEPVFPEVRHQEHPVGLLDERFDRVLLADVGFDDLRTVLGEVVGALAVLVARQREYLHVSLERVSGDGAALRAGRTDDEYGVDRGTRATTDGDKNLTRTARTGQEGDRRNGAARAKTVALLVVGEQPLDHLVGIEPF